MMMGRKYKKKIFIVFFFSFLRWDEFLLYIAALHYFFYFIFVLIFLLYILFFIFSL